MILRFANRDEAMRWYRSPEYQSVIHLRLNSVEGTLILAEGVEAIASDLMAPRDEGHIVLDPAAVERFRSGDLTIDPRAGRENASPSPRPHPFLDSDHIWSLSAAHP